MISEGDEGGGFRYGSRRLRSTTVESDSTDIGTEDIRGMDESDDNASDTDPLHRSSESVFSRDGTTENVQRLLPFPGQQQPPSMDTTPPLRPKENPLTSRPNRVRSQSAVNAGNQGMGLEQFAGTYPGRQVVPVPSRTQSAAYLGGRKGSLGVGGEPLSPLGFKGRSPSGKLFSSDAILGSIIDPSSSYTIKNELL